MLLKENPYRGDVSENDILIVYPLIRGKLKFMKVVGAAAFLLRENAGYLKHIRVSC